MTTSGAPDSRRRYVVAAGLVVLAVALGAVFGVVMSRAIAGYDIDRLPTGEPATVTVGDRELAIWVSPGRGGPSCTAVEQGTSRDSLTTVTAPSMTITEDGRSWERVGVVDGERGSTHLVSCGSEDAVVIGYADNPRVLRYVVLGIGLGGTAVLLMLSAFVLALVTAVRSRAATTARADAASGRRDGQ